MLLDQSTGICKLNLLERLCVKLVYTLFFTNLTIETDGE